MERIEEAMGVEEFSRVYEVTWADLDPNSHLRASVFIDFAINTQMCWAAKYGYTQAKFVELGYDPLILRLEARYYREVTIGESVTDSLKLAAISPDGARWKTSHDFL